MQRLPTTLHLWTVMANIEVSMTPERFDVAGLHAADAMLFGAAGLVVAEQDSLNGFEVPHGDGSDTAFVRTSLQPGVSPTLRGRSRRPGAKSSCSHVFHPRFSRRSAGVFQVPRYRAVMSPLG